MNPKILVKIFASVGLKRISISFIEIFGLFWLLTEPLGLFFSDIPEFGWTGYLALIFISILGAIALRLPRQKISIQLPSPNSIIEVKVGDIFQESGHLAIGFNDCFDTEIGEIIAHSSVQGQFLKRIYDSNRIKLDKDIEAALEDFKYQRKKDFEKSKGKSWRYPIGTTIALGDANRRYFLSAYGWMGNDLKIQSNADYIWLSLNNLWEQVRLKGHGTQVAIPIFGSTLARTNLPRETLLKLIITSFIIASKEQFIANKLTLVIFYKDIDFVNLYDLEDFLNAAVF
ncbi:DUF6430 domain-containing protein [Leptothoe sp. EHU-05/26/07-4]